jgi:HAD superfamily hydrolase (TIGR01450 family)
VELQPWQIITSAEATAAFLKQRFPPGSAVYAIGEDGLKQTISEHGFTLTAEGSRAVVVGLDRKFSYEKLAIGLNLVLQGAMLIGTNPDTTLPVPNGVVPGAGALLASIEAAAGIRATVIGKPHPEMFLQALQRLGTSARETLVVGDRLETDILGGHSAGCTTALVLSGAATELEASRFSPTPTLIARDLSDLVGQLLGNQR